MTCAAHPDNVISQRTACCRADGQPVAAGRARQLPASKASKEPENRTSGGRTGPNNMQAEDVYKHSCQVSNNCFGHHLLGTGLLLWIGMSHRENKDEQMRLYSILPCRCSITWFHTLMRMSICINIPGVCKWCTCLLCMCANTCASSLWVTKNICFSLLHRLDLRLCINMYADLLPNRQAYVALDTDRLLSDPALRSKPSSVPGSIRRKTSLSTECKQKNIQSYRKRRQCFRDSAQPYKWQLPPHLKGKNVYMRYFKIDNYLVYYVYF